MDKLKLGWAGAAAKVITESTGKEVTAEDVAVKATVAVNNKKFGADLFVSVAKDVLKKGTPSARFGTAPRKLGVGTETSGPDVAFYGDPNKDPKKKGTAAARFGTAPRMIDGDGKSGPAVHSYSDPNRDSFVNNIRGGGGSWSPSMKKNPGSSPSPGGRRASISGALTTQVDDGASPVALRPRRQSTGSIPNGVLSTASPRSAAAHVKAQAPAADHESGTGGASPSKRITATTGSESGEIKEPVDDLQKVAAETPATGTAVAA